MVDERRILQVFSNLLANAMRHTSPQGRVTLAAQAEKDAVIFTVEDTGTGIPAEHLPRIFDRFWHYRQGTAGKGTGLGLAIARGIVEAHGGRIWVESPPGQGATFRFTVPLSPVPAERPSDGESAATGASRARRSRQRAARHGLN
jgi:signal transduction histidine kinase